MDFDFDTVLDRRGSSCEKWDGMADLFDVTDSEALPMWVADMDFKAPPVVLEALRRRLDHGVFGYPGNFPEYYDAVVHWMRVRHAWEVRQEWVRFTPGVVAALAFAVQALTKPGDAVIYQSPVYPPIFTCVAQNGRVPVNNRLVIRDGRYRMDLDDLEAKLAAGAKMLILCSPHNPAGRVWTTEELHTLTDLCRAHGAVIVSDEIHHDFAFRPHVHTVLNKAHPKAGEISVVCTAPSKTFNIAGLHTSNAIIENPDLRAAFDNALKTNAVFPPSPFGIEALKAAYTKGGDWLDALLAYLWDNFTLLRDRLQATEKLRVHDAEAMHLAWIDCARLGLTDDELKNALFAQNVIPSMGPFFGPGGEGFVRLNFGCPRSVLEDGVERFLKIV